MNVQIAPAVALLAALAAGPVRADTLQLIYPPREHRTESPTIYFIGSAPPAGELRVNDQPVARNSRGFFAWKLALSEGINRFRWSWQTPDGKSETVERQVIRRDRPRTTAGLVVRWPSESERLLPGEPVCLEAQAAPGSQVQASLAGQTLALAELPPFLEPGDAAAVLAGVAAGSPVTGLYRGCLAAGSDWQNERPRFSSGALVAQAPGSVTALEPQQLTVIEITAKEAIVRAGPGANYARLAPLSQGIRSAVTATSGEWWRLQGEGWVNRADLKVLPAGTAIPRSNVGALRTRLTPAASELLIPLAVRLPTSVRQEESRLVVTLWGARSQTDLIRFEAKDPLIRSVTWEPVTPEGVRYYIDLRSPRQWGYQIRYEGNLLVVSLRRPPQVGRALSGLRVMLDPGHGGGQSGSRGPSGVPEKTVNLQIALKLAAQLRSAGATVLLTRSGDQDISLPRRAELLKQAQPTVFLSLHNNALPDAGDPLRQYGTSVYWYHPQSRSLAEALHRQLLGDLKRPDYGLYWDSLAVIRPTEAPAVLLELGFMTHPDEFALLVTPAYQERIAAAVVRGLDRWLHSGDAG